MQGRVDHLGQVPGGAAVLGSCPQGPSELSGDLPLTHHHGGEPAGDPEQVVQGVVLLVHVPVHGRGQLARQAEPEVGFGHVRGVEQELDTVAGVEGDDASHAGNRAEASGQSVRMLRNALHLGQALAVMLNREDAKVHDGSS